MAGWLIGETFESIIERSYPSKQQVLSIITENYTKQFETNTGDKPSTSLGEKARIPTTQERNIVPKVVKLFSEWKTVQKRSKIKKTRHRYRSDFLRV